MPRTLLGYSTEKAFAKVLVLSISMMTRLTALTLIITGALIIGGTVALLGSFPRGTFCLGLALVTIGLWGMIRAK